MDIVERLREHVESSAILKMARINDQLRENAEELMAAIESGDQRLIAEKENKARLFLEYLKTEDE